MATEDIKPTEIILLVYVGSRITSSNELSDYWMQVTSEQFDEGIMPPNADNCYNCYAAKSVKKNIGGSPGACYAVPQIVSSSSIYSGEAKYQGLWPDENQRLKWQLDHRTAITTIDLRKKSKKESAEDNFALLLPIREKYGKLISQNQRAALLAQVIAYITNG